MSTWVYEARDAAGKPVSGTHTANDRHEALEFLRSQGLFLTKLESTRGGSAPNVKTQTSSVPAPPLRPPTPVAYTGVPRTPEGTAPTSVLSSESAIPAPIYASHQNPNTAAEPIPNQPLLRSSKKDLALYFSQMGSMIHAGTSLGSALHSMGDNAPNAALRKASRQMERHIMTGEQLSRVMESYPGMFTPLQIGMVNAGERGGFLETMFARLSTYAERDYDIETSIKRETWYPKLLVFASIFVPSVVPLYLQGWGAWFHNVLPPLFIIVLILVAWKMFKIATPFTTRAGGPRAIIDGVKLFVPIAGKVARGLATAKFCRAMAALYSAGVMPSEAVKLSANACGNSAIASRAIAMIPRIEKGESLTTCMASTGYFPDMAMQMMRVGEQSGALDEQLDKAADFLERDSETAIRQAIPVLGILAFLVVAYQIGMQVISVWSGYGDMINDLTK